MTDTPVNLTDPTVEPSLQDFERLCQAAGDHVRAESALLAKQNGQQDEGKPAPNQSGVSFDSP